MEVTSLEKEYQNDLFSRIKEVIADGGDLYLSKKKDSEYYYSEIYADYRDTLSDDVARKILKSNEPIETLDEMMFEWYYESECDLEKEVRDLVASDTEVQDIFAKLQKCSVIAKNYDIDEYCLDYIREVWYVKYPTEHYLGQDVQLDIVIDIGDANYDFCCNNILNYCGNGEIDEHSSILWLCKQQGKEKEFRDAIIKYLNTPDYITKELTFEDRVELLKKKAKNSNGITKMKLDLACEIMNEDDMEEKISLLDDWEIPKEIDERNYFKCEDKFIKSIIQELENLPTQLGRLTFCIECSLEEAIELKEKLKEKKGTFVISKSTTCGLYDPWNGSGSVLEIELDKDVEVPMEMIHSALPDGSLGYSIESIYAPTNIWRAGDFKIKED